MAAHKRPAGGKRAAEAFARDKRCNPLSAGKRRLVPGGLFPVALGPVPRVVVKVLPGARWRRGELGVFRGAASRLPCLTFSQVQSARNRLVGSAADPQKQELNPRNGR